MELPRKLWDYKKTRMTQIKTDQRHPRQYCGKDQLEEQRVQQPVR